MALRGFKRRLVDNSIDAYVLSLETINRLSVEYRLEAFCMLLCNSWELLLKARIAQLYGPRAIYYPKESGKSRRTLSGKDCARKVFSNEQLNYLRNLEKVIDLRDECTHLVISKVPSDIVELLQSCVINYHSCLEEWFDVSLADRVPVGMMTIVFDIAPFSSDITMLRKGLGAEEIKFLTKFQAEIREESWILGHPTDYVARIDHKVQVVNKSAQADIHLVGGAGGTPVHIVEKPRDPAKTHPLRTMKLVKEVQERTNASPPFTEYLFRSVRHVWGIRERHEWYYCSEIENSSPQYKQELADKIVDEITRDPHFLEHCKSQFRANQHASSKE